MGTATAQNVQAAAYIRCSTDKQDQSLDDQKAAILSYAEEEDLEIVRWFEDEGRSGTKAETRPGFQELLHTVENGKKEFKKLLVYDVSRWGRYGDPDEAAYWEFHCRRHGVGVEYTDEDFKNDGSMGSQIIKQVRRTTAGQYSKDLARLTIRGNKSNAKKGFFNGGQPPYGYRRLLCEPDGTPIKELAPGERKAEGQKIKLSQGPQSEVKTVRRIFRLYVTHGYSAKGIVRLLNKEREGGGPSSPRGGEWTISTLHGILRNPTYCGRIVWNRLCHHHLVYPREIGKHHDPEEWVICKDAHPPIVSEEMFEKAQKSARHNATYRKPKPTSPYLLVGLIRCMRCGHNFQGHRKAPSKKKPNSYRYYVCSTYQRLGRSECVSFSLPKEEIEAEIIKQIHKRLKRSGALKRIAHQLEQQLTEQTVDPEARIEEYEVELQEVKAKEKRILKSIEDGMAYSLASERLEHLGARRDQIQDEIAALDATEGVETDPEAALSQMMAFLRDFKEILDYGTLDEKRAFIRCFVDRIEVDPDVPSIEVLMCKIPNMKHKDLEEIGVLAET